MKKKVTICTMSIRIRPKAPFSFELAFDFLQRSPRELLHRMEDDKIVKVLKVDGVPMLFSLHREQTDFVLSFLNYRPGSEQTAYVIDYINQWLDLITDLQPFYKQFKNDALIGPLIKKYKGYRIVGQPDLFESLVWAVLGQQINLGFAYTLKQRFVESFGEVVEHEGMKHYLFPAPQRVAQLTRDQLLALQFSRQKADYTIGLAHAFASGQLSKNDFKNLTLNEAKEKLMVLKGIGNWTANYALMKTFRYPNAFPLEDAGLHNAIRNLRQMKSKPNLEQVKRLFKKYRGWEAYATLYLWKSLGDAPQKVQATDSHMIA